MHFDRRTFIASLVLRPLVAPPRFASALQARLNESMTERQGSALVLSVKSGEVLAQYRIAGAAKRLVPPGSVIKPFVLTSLIESNIVQPSTRQKCGRVLRINGRTLDCSHVDTGEALDPVSALAYSCNSYFARVAVALDRQALVRTLTSFGLTSSTRLAPSEVTGSITLPNDTGQLQLLALGEAGIRVTALEIASAYRRLALIKRDDNARTIRLALLFDGLSAATQYGTARLARPRSLSIAGKTGTATDQAGGRTHAWFAGYGPFDSPEVVVVIYLETGSGGGDAAPIAKEVFEAV